MIGNTHKTHNQIWFAEENDRKKPKEYFSLCDTAQSIQEVFKFWWFQWAIEFINLVHLFYNIKLKFKAFNSFV